MHGERSDPENDSTLSFFDPKCGDTNTDVGRRSRSSAPEPTLLVFNSKPHYGQPGRLCVLDLKYIIFVVRRRNNVRATFKIFLNVAGRRNNVRATFKIFLNVAGRQNNARATFKIFSNVARTSK